MSRPADPDEAFAARYRDVMVRTLDRFEFFGVDPRGIPRRHSFAAGYVALTLNQRDLGDEGVVSAGARADQALRDQPRALVRGVAGSGKSTLLRWLGAAPDESANVPFLLELGRYPDGRPPHLTEVVAEPLRQQMPGGWVDRMLADGRVLLLLDGLDEVRARERANLETWVDDLLAAFPDIRCVVTTRPSVVAEQWWVDRCFQRFDLLPMSRHSVEKYVRGWHEVARADHPDGSEARESLRHAERRLLTTLSNRPALRGMSANPLLCGLLCALHVVRGEQLPENRKEVYEAALDLLLSRWPAMRRRHLQVGAPESDTGQVEMTLSKEEQEKLLQRLAYWLVTNLEPVLTPDDARDRLPSFMLGLRSQNADPDRVLHHLAHESGLLRELPNRSLEFLHRTFRDHLAAKEVVEEGNLGLMLDSADKPHWHDVVVMAGAHARPAERRRILLTLLDRGMSDDRHREALYLLAAAILEQTAVLPPPDSQHVRDLVAAAITELIPPRTPGAADQLAAAGEFVLDLLPGPDGLAAEPAALVVRAAARIAAQWNPPGAVEKILQFTANRSSRRAISELLEAWGRPGDYEKYAREVLSEIDFSRFTVDLQNGRRIEHVGHLRTITSLVLRNDMRDLKPIADLPRLRRLTLRDNGMTALAPLALSASLRVLVLERCSTLAGVRPIDLSPLAKPPALRRLVVSGITAKVDHGSLAGVRLHSLKLRGGVVLPPGLHVRHLTLLSGAGQINLAGVTGIRSIILDWAPSRDEEAMLAALPELRRLVLWRMPPDTPTPRLPGVEVMVALQPVAVH